MKIKKKVLEVRKGAMKEEEEVKEKEIYNFSTTLVVLHCI